MPERKNGAPLPFRPKASFPRQFARVFERIARERAAADMVERLLLNTPEARWSELAEHPDFRTFGAIERLGRIFTDILPRDHGRAYALAQLAVSLAENLPPRLYPAITYAQTTAATWKDLGTTLRFLGRKREALEALTHAEAVLKPGGMLVYDIAIVRFSLAMTLQELERFDESRAMLAECKEIFRDHGDDYRFVLCSFAQGVLLQRLKSYREAREVYLLLLASTEPIPNETLAVIHRAIGLCSLELGEYREAESHLARSITLHEQLGQRMEVIKGEACLGRLYIRTGEADRAVTHLRPLRREFLRNRLTEEAGLCGLEIVEGLLLLGKTSQAESLARTIVREFTTAGLNTRAITALGYLAEAIAEGKATHTLASGVREYIVSLRTSPERDFTDE